MELWYKEPASYWEGSASAGKWKAGGNGMVRDKAGENFVK